MSNPYTLVFGQPPVENIERTAQAERIVSEFCQERPSNYINLITGIRGCGKTVFITEIAERLRRRKEWIVVNLNPKRDLLVSLAAKLESDAALRRIFKEAEINLQAFGIGIGIKGGYPVSDIEEALTRMLQSIKKHGKRVLITIDEASNTKEMRIFASSYQIFLRERLPVFLLMTGLFKNIDRLRNADGMTFLERAPRTRLSSLDLTVISVRYKETLGIGEDKAIHLAHMTKGYPFAYQVLGYLRWDAGKKAELSKLIPDYDQHLEEYVYEKIWMDLSDNDKKVVELLALNGEMKIKDIRDVLEMKSGSMSVYRDRLIRKGIVDASRYGYLSLVLPRFAEIVQRWVM